MDQREPEPDGEGALVNMGSPQMQEMAQKSSATHRTQSLPPQNVSRIAATVSDETPRLSQLSQSSPPHSNREPTMSWQQEENRSEEEKMVEPDRFWEGTTLLHVARGEFVTLDGFFVPESIVQQSGQTIESGHTFKDGRLLWVPTSTSGEPSTSCLPSTSAHPSMSSRPPIYEQQLNLAQHLVETESMRKDETQKNTMVAIPFDGCRVQRVIDQKNQQDLLRHGSSSKSEDISIHVHKRMIASTTTPNGQETGSFPPTMSTFEIDSKRGSRQSFYIENEHPSLQSSDSFNAIEFTIDSVSYPSFNPETSLDPCPTKQYPARVSLVGQHGASLDGYAPRTEDVAPKIKIRAPQMKEHSSRSENPAPHGTESFEVQQNRITPPHVAGGSTEAHVRAPPNSRVLQVSEPLGMSKNKPGRPRMKFSEDGSSFLPPKKSRHYISKEDKAMSEQEQRDLLMNLPPKLRIQIENQKEREREEKILEKTKPKRKYMKQVKPQPVEEEPPSDFLKAIELFKAAMSGAEHEPIEKRPRGQPRMKEKKLTKKQLAELQKQKEEMNRNQPVATAVAISRAPLTLNIYHNPPTFIEAPVWTDDSGPLVPHSLYRTDAETSQEGMTPEEHPQESRKPPRIVTKAALKIIPPPVKNTGPVLGDFYDLPRPLDTFPALQQSKWGTGRDGLIKDTPRFKRKRIDISTVNKATSRAVSSKPAWAENLVRKELKDEEFMGILETVFRELRLFASTFENQQYNSCKGMYDQGTRNEMQKKSVHKINAVYNTWLSEWTHAKGVKFDGYLKRMNLQWSQWHDLMVTAAVVRSKHEIVDLKLTQIDEYTALTHGRLRRVSSQDFRSQLESVCFQIQDLCRWLKKTVDCELKDVNEPNAMFQLTNTEYEFELKWEAVKERMTIHSAARIQYTNEDLRNAITSWKRATEAYITFDELKQAQAIKEMRAAHSHLVRTFNIFTSIVDVCNFSSRMHILCNHVHELYREAEGTEEDRAFTLRQIKKTEFLLMIAESKAMLVQSADHASPEKTRRIEMFNTFIEGDSMNVEKSKLKRMIVDEEDEARIAMCEKILNAKAERFCLSLRRIKQSGLQKLMPTKPWIEVIQDELKTERKQEKPESPIMSSTNALAEIVFFDPIDTSSLEELLNDYSDLDKVSHKLAVREFCHNSSERAKLLQSIHTNCRKKLCNDVEQIHMESLRENESCGQECVGLEIQLENKKQKGMKQKNETSGARKEKLEKFADLNNVSVAASNRDFYALMDNLKNYEGLKIDLLLSGNKHAVKATLRKLQERGEPTKMAENL